MKSENNQLGVWTNKLFHEGKQVLLSNGISQKEFVDFYNGNSKDNKISSMLLQHGYPDWFINLFGQRLELIWGVQKHDKKGLRPFWWADWNKIPQNSVIWQTGIGTLPKAYSKANHLIDKYRAKELNFLDPELIVGKVVEIAEKDYLVLRVYRHQAWVLSPTNEKNNENVPLNFENSAKKPSDSTFVNINNNQTHWKMEKIAMRKIVGKIKNKTLKTKPFSGFRYQELLSHYKPIIRKNLALDDRPEQDCCA